MIPAKTAILLLHALVGWALCGAVMGIGPLLMTMETALIVHAILGPVFFALLSLLYFRKFNYTSPLATASVFVGFVIGMDFLVVALLVEKSFAMFRSVLGTWLPFTLIFLATYVTGRLTTRLAASRTP